MKLSRILAVTGIAALMAGCGDLEVVNLNDPDRARAVSTPTDVESLISGSFSSWWGSGHYNGAGIAMSTMADAHTSSWGNFGMQHASSEPRAAYNNDPSYSYAYVNRDPWRYSYRALSGVRDGLGAIEGGVELGTNGEDTPRAQAFGALVQGLALGTLAVTFDQAFIIDENTSLEDPAALPLQPWPEVLDAALAKLDQAISMSSQSFTIPSDWVGGGGDWSNTRMGQVAHSYKARFMISAPRDEAGRAAVNWQQVLTEAEAGITEDFNTVYDGDNWAWDRLKHHGGTNPGWGRIDLHMVGPADADSDWRDWLALPPEQRQPFTVDTDDRRVTGGTPDSDGKYIGYLANHPFRPERGTYHFSNYTDLRWLEIVENGYEGTNGEFPVKELDFIKAEAHYRLGNLQAAADLVNAYRVPNGELPAVTVDGVPEGDRCVPKTQTGACGDLWEALKYDKRVEVWHYGYGVEFFDDRGWGDLVTNTPVHFPVPGSELDLLLMEIYTFGGGGPGSAPDIRLDGFTLKDVADKAEALEAFDRAARAEVGMPSVF